MKILYAAAEAVPFCKTGGLGDVAGSLPNALAAMGVKTSVVLPLYQRIKNDYFDQMEFIASDYVKLSWRNAYCGLYRMKKDAVTYFFLDNEQYFDRENIYGYAEDGERFGFFSRAIVSMLKYMDYKPDIIHCNDWHTALVPVYLRVDGKNNEWFRSIKTVLTIHNIAYQGKYAMEAMGDLFGLKNTCVDNGIMEMDGRINLLKAGIVCANAVNTVSPTYAEELQLEYFSHGLSSIIQKNSFKIRGILNGLDTVLYNPDIDKNIHVTYNNNSVLKRRENKLYLQNITGLREEPDIPIIGIVSRLVEQKGFELITAAFEDIMSLGVQIAVIGQGETRFENFFNWAAKEYPGRVSYTHEYAEEVAAAIYAGSDLFLMPSRTEPCGLAQMIAMRYGSVPVVRCTGGLKDTVKDYDALNQTGTGFVFNNYTPGDMYFMVRQAVELYRSQPKVFEAIQKRAMSQDLSWKSSAEAYVSMFESVL